MVTKRVFKKFMNKTIIWALLTAVFYCVILFIVKELKGKTHEITMEKLKLELSKENVNQGKGKIVKTAPNELANTLEAVNSDSERSKESSHNQSAVTVNPANVKVGLPTEKFCPNLNLPPKVPSPETWQPVDESKSMYVYSAYYNKQGKKIYVTGVRPEHNVTVFCQSWRNEDLIDVTEAETQLVNYCGFK